MRLGYHTGYWSAGPPPGAADAVRAADELGLDSVWTAEAYGSDALTPLAWWGASTRRVRLGTAIAQLSARTPTAAAMAALTLDHLSGGRFVLGLGASGLPADQGAGLGKALRSTVHPLRADLPIHLAAEGPKNVAMSAEIADGWLPLFYSPRMDATYRELLADGFAKRSPRLRPPAQFEVVATVPVVLAASVEEAADSVRPFIALYAGGMGAKGANFHRDVLDRLGYREACDEIQAHYLAGDRERAAAAVPTELVTDVALVGTEDDVRAQLPAWRATAVTTVLAQADPRALPRIAALWGDPGHDDGTEGRRIADPA